MSRQCVICGSKFDPSKDYVYICHECMISVFKTGEFCQPILRAKIAQKIQH